jgi:hypothetical protein
MRIHSLCPGIDAIAAATLRETSESIFAESEQLKLRGVQLRARSAAILAACARRRERLAARQTSPAPGCDAD